MSRNHDDSPTHVTSVLNTHPDIFPEDVHFVFIRRLQKSDKEAAEKLCARNVDSVDPSHEPRYGIFNLDHDLVGLEEDVETAFRDADHIVIDDKPFVLQWIH